MHYSLFTASLLFMAVRAGESESDAAFYEDFSIDAQHISSISIQEPTNNTDPVIITIELPQDYQEDFVELKEDVENGTVSGDITIDTPESEDESSDDDDD